MTGSCPPHCLSPLCCLHIPTNPPHRNLPPHKPCSGHTPQLSSHHTQPHLPPHGQQQQQLLLFHHQSQSLSPMPLLCLPSQQRARPASNLPDQCNNNLEGSITQGEVQHSSQATAPSSALAGATGLTHRAMQTSTPVTASRVSLHRGHLFGSHPRLPPHPPLHPLPQPLQPKLYGRRASLPSKATLQPLTRRRLPRTTRCLSHLRHQHRTARVLWMCLL